MTNKELEQQVNEVKESQKTILSTLESLKNSLDTIQLKKEEVKPKVKEEVKIETKYPVPMEYKDILETTLNGNFGITIEPCTDQPAFTFMIVVPDKYSSMTPQEKEMYKVDIRPKVISYAEGLNGVRLWAEKVFSNFKPEIKAMIVADRAQYQQNAL